MYILGMESSCDETSAAVVEMGEGVRAIRSNVIASQIETQKSSIISRGIFPAVS